MTVFENVAFGLRVRPRRERPSGSDITSAVKYLLQLVELDALGGRYPSELSGGQQQRVALARALAVQPRVLLLDEPFGALDARVRKQLRQWLRQLHDEVKVTTILVTHDSEEACEVADRVAVMHEGRIAQIGTAAELMLETANPFLGAFLAEPTRASGSTKIDYH
jgi:sulfate transport system ATP-binding protein